METILAFLNEPSNSTLLPLIKWAWVVGGLSLSFAAFGIAICRDEVKAALRMAGISHKEAAITMGISEGLLSHKLSGDKPLTFEALAALPAIFWQWLGVELAHHYGVPAIVASGGRLSRRQARLHKAGGVA